MNWSTHQQDIFRAVAESNDSLLIEAVAGSGKTTTIVEAINYVSPGKSVAFVAFNKAIADELGRRITRVGAACMTLHSAGLSAWKRSLGWDSNLLSVDGDKTFRIMKEVMAWKEREKWGETTRWLVGLGKQHGIVPASWIYWKEEGAEKQFTGLSDDSDDAWETLATHYGIDFEDVNLGLVRKVLARGIEISRESVDFDDMLYMPVIAGVSFDQYDVVFVDEAQDLSGIQMEMVARMASGRVIAVGDRRQAIYGFRGAHSGAMDEIRQRFNCRELPLSVTYRCPVAVVQHAQQWAPQIIAREDAPWGYVGVEGTDWKGQASIAQGAPHCSSCGEPVERSYSIIREDVVIASELCLMDAQDIRDSFLEQTPTIDCQIVDDVIREEGISKWRGLSDLVPGDAVLCRVTRPLISLAFAMVRARIPCRVLGRDIGQGLVGLIKKAKLSPDADLSELEEWMTVYEAKQRTRLLARREFAALGSLEDKLSTIRVFMEGVSDGVDHGAGSGARVGMVPETVGELIEQISGLFEDSNGRKAGVVLSTIHKSKGLEFTRVFVLDAGELMPSPWARKEWELEQEFSLMYVAATRASRELRYVRSEELSKELGV